MNKEELQKALENLRIDVEQKLKEIYDNFEEELSGVHEDMIEWWADVKDFVEDNFLDNVEDLTEKLFRSTGLNLKLLEKRIDNGEKEAVLDFLDERIENGDNWDSNLAKRRKKTIEWYIKRTGK